MEKQTVAVAVLKRGKQVYGVIQCPHCKSTEAHYLRGFAQNEDGITGRRYECFSTFCKQFFILH